MALCTVKIELDDGEILVCRRSAHGDEVDHRDWMTEFKIVPEGIAVRRYAIVAEEIVPERNDCEGHESLDGAHMGETVFCDGSCV